MLGSEEGVRQARESALVLFNELATLATEAKTAAPNLNLEFGKDTTEIVVRTPRASILVGWHNIYINTLDKSCLYAGLFRGSLILPGENRYYIQQPQAESEYRFLPERTRALDWCWKLDQVTRSSTELAEYLMGLLLDEVERRNISPRF